MRNILSEIKRDLYIRYFFLSCGGVVLVCLMNEGYSMISSGKTYSILELLLFLDRNVMLTDVRLNRYEIWVKGIGTWTVIVLPFLLGLGYLYAISSEKQSGMIKFLLIREGAWRYSLSKVVSVMFTGGIIMLIGYICFGVLIYLRFPSVYEYPAELIDGYMQLYPDFQEGIMCLKRCLGIFLYGMCINVIPFLVSVFFTDKYILLCLPVMIKYMWDGMKAKFIIYSMRTEDDQITKLFSAMGFENVIDMNSDNWWKLSFLFFLLLYLLSAFLNLFLLKKKGGDYGFE